jgi:acetyl-CoA synthetase
MTKQASHTGLTRLLRPRHIAVFGGRFAEEVIRQSERIGFTGDIWPVNPGRRSLAGRRCYRDVGDLPEAPDASFIAVPREANVGLVEALSAQGAGGAVCYASGFAETDDQGRALQAALAGAAGDLAVVGPNCYGVLNYLDGATLWPDVHGGARVDEGVAIVTQSGNIGISLTMQQRSLPLGYLISVGNQAVLSVADYIEALIADARIKAIGIHIESVEDVERFSAVAVAAHAARVPLVALKVGRSELGAEAALSHTSSLVGDDTHYDALFRRLRVARVQTLPELLETLKLLAITGPLPGRRIASISCSGGEAALVADTAASMGMEMPAFGAKEEARLRKTLGPMVNVANPLDYHTFIWGDPDAQRECFSAVLAGKQEVTVKVLDYLSPKLSGTEDWDNTIDVLIDAAGEAGARAALISTLPENLPDHVRTRLQAAGVAPLQGLQEGMGALKVAMDIGAWFAESAGAPLPVTVFNGVGGETGGIETIDEWRAKAELSRFGVDTPRGTLADMDSLLASADGIGYPLVLKAAAPDLVHKTESGAVILNIRDADELKRGADGMRWLGDRFLVEAMAPAAVAELLVGVTRDAQFGLALTIAAGGTLVGLLADARTILFPVTEPAVEEAVGELRIAKLLDGYRGGPPGDRRAAVAAIMAISAYAEAHADRLEELDVNPLLVLPEGEGAVAVDALIRLREESSK